MEWTFGADRGGWCEARIGRGTPPRASARPIRRACGAVVVPRRSGWRSGPGKTVRIPNERAYVAHVTEVTGRVNRRPGHDPAGLDAAVSTGGSLRAHKAHACASRTTASRTTASERPHPSDRIRATASERPHPSDRIRATASERCEG